MKNLCKLLGFIALVALIGFAIFACKEPIGPPNNDTTGSITGKALFNNSDNHAGITITLEKTDGLRSVNVVNANRSIVSGARSISATRSVAGQTQTAVDGSFILNDIPAGTYVLYASSQNSLEKAVTTNVTVTANQEFNAGTLNLTPVGSIAGQITVQSGSPMGYLVCVAGTSFMAITGTDGKFEITGVPAKTGYTVLIMRGDFVAFYGANASVTTGVTGGNTTTLSTRNITNLELLQSTVTIGANGNWFINGVDTGISATGQQGEKGETGEKGDPGTNGNTPYIGTNGNWWIGTTDTGVKVQGPQGEQGQDGNSPFIGLNGNWWVSTTDTGVKVKDYLIEMVYVPGGSFELGRELNPAVGGSDETPVSNVNISGFFMGKYQVTQEQYLAVMGTNPSYFDGSIGREPASGEVQERRPVEQVSWYDALVFCNRLSIMEGLTPAYIISGSTNPNDWGTVPTNLNTTWDAVQIVSGSTGYRLPTEAQWEYAAKGGNGSPGNFTYSGSNDPDAVAWRAGNSGSRTHEVGKKAPNSLGIYDMSGNIFEWCWDGYGNYTSTTKTDPMGASSGSSRVFRGGGWLISSENVRSVDRFSNFPSGRYSYVGFRVSCPRPE
ncbi:MAG: SUMF1/EgtB/PvdO family nonheme iron enzyme [Treponema sp.]|nr:SUMF1/EgtB/PvdO family nonheme iron enzyme [Treponema sp.]